MPSLFKVFLLLSQGEFFGIISGLANKILVLYVYGSRLFVNCRFSWSYWANYFFTDWVYFCLCQPFLLRCVSSMLIEAVLFLLEISMTMPHSYFSDACEITWISTAKINRDLHQLLSLRIYSRTLPAARRGRYTRARPKAAFFLLICFLNQVLLQTRGKQSDR